MFFSRIRLQCSRTIVLLNTFELLKKSIFQKRQWSCDFPPRKTLAAQQHRAISRQEMMAFCNPRRVALDLPSPSPESVRTCAWAYADVTTKISRNDRSPGFPTNGAPLCGLRPQRRSAIAGLHVTL